MLFRNYTSWSNTNPVATYNNFLLHKEKIFKDNKNKFLVYCWINNINGKTYVGSTVNFYSRFHKYFNTEYLKKHNTPLHNSLLKYGYSNFTLQVLEYCNKEDTIKREQYYLNLLKPVYNILQTAGSSLGFKHSKDTLDYFKKVRKLSAQAKEKLSIAASNRVLSSLEKTKLSVIRKGTKLSDNTKKKISSTITSLIGVPVSILDTKTSTEKHYISLTEAANDIGISRTAIKKASVTGNILKQRYIASQVKYENK